LVAEHVAVLSLRGPNLTTVALLGLSTADTLDIRAPRLRTVVTTAAASGTLRCVRIAAALGGLVSVGDHGLGPVAGWKLPPPALRHFVIGEFGVCLCSLRRN
jgi:hypothetical protein